ncbi:hypothetical protein [Celeribacter marinus]|uniref:hypothetical protein n=1 Tax=Celeribacter marinus TaxID=1397108 RepID=UPI00317F5177
MKLTSPPPQGHINIDPRMPAKSAAALLSITAIPATVEFADDSGDRTITIGSETFTIGHDPKSLRSGSVFQTPSAIRLPADTVEARLQDAVFAALAERYGPNLASSLAAALVRSLAAGVWSSDAEVDGPVTDLARAARRTPSQLRGTIAAAAAAAHDHTGNEGIKRVAQVAATAPVVFQMATTEHDVADLGRAIADGKSPMSILTDAGATKIISRLSQNAIPLVNAGNIETVCAALTAAGHNKLPSGRKQASWLSALLTVMAHDEPAPGFFEWIAAATAQYQQRGDITVAVPIWAQVADWATETAGQQSGWHADKTVVGSLLAAIDWGERQAKQHEAWADGRAPFPHVFDRFLTADNLFVEQITSAKDLLNAGTRLQNCLASMPTTFAKYAEDGERFYAVTRNARALRDTLVPGAIRTAVEIIASPDGPTIRQHFGRCNSNPPERDRKAVAELMASLAKNNTSEGK